MDLYQKFVSKACAQANRDIDNFKGGRVKQFLTSDNEILSIIQGLQLEFISNPHQSRIIRQRKFCDSESLAIDNEIKNLIDKSVIVESQHEDDQFLSPIFLRPKKNGTYRLICNLQELNENIAYHHFKMESLQTAIQMMTKGCYMASIDLKDAYYCIPIEEEYQKYLKFQWRSKLYKYTACPMGLCMSPRIFTKTLKPIFSTLRHQGHQSVVYIDDTYLQGETKESCCNNVEATATLLTKVGFVINPEKSVWQPTQCIEFLGFVLNSVTMTVSLTKSKVERISELCKSILKKNLITIRECCQFIGTLISTLPAVPHGKLFYRQLENEKIIALKQACGQFESKMQFSHTAKSDINWWLENIHEVVNPICRGEPDVVIETDASMKGWGGVCRHLNLIAGGPWKVDEANYHINVLELQAALYTLKSFFSDKKNIHIQLLMDSVTAVYYVREQGGCKSLKCNEIAREIWNWALHRNIWLSSAHIPGKNNCQADFESRNFKEEYEWKLDENTYLRATHKLQFKPEIDLFASRMNYQISKYVSWRPEPEAYAVDAFSISWKNQKIYCFPPFSIIPAVLQKMHTDKATGIVVVPNWPTQPFYATLMKMLVDYPIFIKKRPSLLTLPGKTSVHKIWDRLDLLVCLLSGDQSKIINFRKTLQTSLCRHGEKEPQNNTNVTSTNGRFSVVDGISIQFTHL